MGLVVEREQKTDKDIDQLLGHLLPVYRHKICRVLSTFNAINNEVKNVAIFSCFTNQINIEGVEFATVFDSIGKISIPHLLKIFYVSNSTATSPQNLLTIL